jgi:hypothetical protein
MKTKIDKERLSDAERKRLLNEVPGGGRDEGDD